MNDLEAPVLILVLAAVVTIAAVVAIARALSSVADEHPPAAPEPGDSTRDILSVDLSDRD